MIHVPQQQLKQHHWHETMAVNFYCTVVVPVLDHKMDNEQSHHHDVPPQEQASKRLIADNFLIGISLKW